MGALRRLFRTLLFIAFFILIPGGVGAFFNLKYLGPVFAGSGVLFLFLFLAFSDRWLMGLLSAVQITRGPLVSEIEGASIRLAIRDGIKFPRNPRNLPKIYVFQEAFPVFFVVRALTGGGCVLMSQGFLSSIPNARLQELAELSLDRLRTPGLVRVTGASVVVEVLLRFSPSGWSEWFAARALSVPLSKKLKPLSWTNAVQALLLIPFVWFFGYLATDQPWIIQSKEEGSGFTALRPLMGSRLIPGLSHELPSLSMRGLSLQMPLPSA